MKINITNHLRRRFYERFLNEEYKMVSYRDLLIYKMLNESVEFVYQNDTRIVYYFYEKFGLTNLKLFKHKESNLYFVLKRHEVEKNKFIALTCYIGFDKFFSNLTNKEATMKLIQLKKERAKKPFLLNLKCDY